MTEDEVIIVNGIAKSFYNAIVKEAIEYALISKPFTIRRMGNQTLAQALLNIFKGKLAEGLCTYFFKLNHIIADQETTTTAFWQVDNKDFILDGKHWDLKNNFIYHNGYVLETENYTDLPALVPNRYANDQWQVATNAADKNNYFLFSYLKAAALENGERVNPFCSLHLSKEQEALLVWLEEKYQGKAQTQEPYTAERFFAGLKQRGPTNFITMHHYPVLVITAFAGPDEYNIFRDTGKFDTQNNFINYLSGYWYNRMKSGSLNFMNGCLWTTISNATAPVSLLPSFLSRYPHLKKELHAAEIKKINTAPGS